MAMETQIFHPEKSLKSKIFIQGSFLFLISYIAFLIGGYVLGWILWVLGIGLVILGLIYLLVPMYVDTITYELTNEQIIVNVGLITKTNKIVPYRTITNINVSRGPFDRIFGLTTIKVETAGTGGPKATPEEMLIGLSDSDANKIHNTLKSKLNALQGGSAGVTHDLETDLTILKDIRSDLRLLIEKLN